MCGISGVVSSTQLDNSQLAQARHLNACIEHRGPDEDGWYVDKRVILGMRRLSIIDISGSTQPLYSQDKSVIVVFNGEIYNYIELQTMVQELGYTLTTNGDGELISHLYDEFDIEFTKHLRGMYSIALYDSKIEQVFLIRDRMGEKPLFYYTTENELFFSSELKAISEAIPNEQRELNTEVVHQYLLHNFGLEPDSMIKGIQKIPTAHYAQIDINTLDVSLHNYWNMLSAEPQTSDAPHKAVYDELLYVHDIIGRSDVPVGIALSGGLDSSTVAALTHQHNANKDITHAITVGYEGTPVNDERAKAQVLADSLGITLHQVELSVKDFVNDFPTLVHFMDEPVADIAAYNIYAVMRKAHELGIKVMLNGIGADEIFWGYPWVIQALKESSDTELSLYAKNPDFQFGETFFASLYGKSMQHDPAIQYGVKKLHGDETPELQMMQHLAETWLSGDPIALGDRLSMAHSIELRSPFLDYKLIELVVGLNKTDPSIATQPAKQLLRDAVQDILPQEVLNRPKQGFAPPTRTWMWAIIDEYSHLLTNGYLIQHQIIKPWATKIALAAIRPPFRDRLKSTNLRMNAMYKLITLEVWCRMYLDNQTPNDLR